jgi:hypothetical protein
MPPVRARSRPRRNREVAQNDPEPPNGMESKIGNIVPPSQTRWAYGGSGPCCARSGKSCPDPGQAGAPGSPAQCTRPTAARAGLPAQAGRSPAPGTADCPCLPGRVGIIRRERGRGQDSRLGQGPVCANCGICGMCGMCGTCGTVGEPSVRSSPVFVPGGEAERRPGLGTGAKAGQEPALRPDPGREAAATAQRAVLG